ncbi:MAG: hypothetical protein QGG14_01435 [Planctomycetota bacterium]|nr:hypothetical protein [Planctomycetota bacterium]
MVVVFNARDFKRIERRVTQLEKERGYSVTISEALRELVRESWS